MPGQKNGYTYFKDVTTPPLSSEIVVGHKALYTMEDGVFVEDASGKIVRLDDFDLIQSVSGALSESISAHSATVYRGSLALDTTNYVYTVNHGEVSIPLTTPLVTLTSPSNTSVLYIAAVRNRTSSSFDVVISDVPNEPGYSIDWLVIGEAILSGGGSGGPTDILGTGTVTISAQQSIVPTSAAAFDLGSAAMPWRDLHLSGQTIYLGGVPVSISGTSLLVNDMFVATTTSPDATAADLSNYATNSALVAVESNLQSQIDTLSGVAGDLATVASVELTASNLISMITDEATARSDADALLTPLATTSSLTGNLQTQINTNGSNLTAHIGSGGSAHAVATTGVAGFITGLEKQKLTALTTTPSASNVQYAPTQTGILTGVGYTDTLQKSLDDINIYAAKNSLVVHNTGNESIAGQKTFTNDMTVQGNLYVTGTTTTVSSQQLQVKDNLITVNYGEVGTGVTNTSAGMEVARGSSPNYYFAFFENTDTFRVGEAGNTQAVATREDSPISGGLAFWNPTTYRFETNSESTSASFVKKSGDTLTGSLQINLSGLTPALSTLNLSALRVINPTGTQVSIDLESYGANNTGLWMYAADGSASVPTAVTNGRVLGQIRGYGYDGSAWALGSRLTFQPTETWSTTAHGCTPILYGTKIGTVVVSTVLSFNTSSLFANVIGLVADVGNVASQIPGRFRGGAGTSISIDATQGGGSDWRIGDAIGASNGTFVIYDYTNSKQACSYTNADGWTMGNTIVIDKGAANGTLIDSSNPTRIALYMSNVDGQGVNFETVSFGSGIGLAIRPSIALGTRAVPTAIGNAYSFIDLSSRGYDGSTWTNNNAMLRIMTDGAWTTTSHGTKFSFLGTPNGSLTAAEWLTLQNGNATFSGQIVVANGGTINGQLVINQALRVQNWSGVPNNGVVYFGTGDNYIFKNSSQFTFSVEGTFSATLNSGGTIWTANNDGAGSGLDADMVDGYHADIFPNGSTLAARDSSGYLHAQYFNQWSSNNENPAISQFIVTSSDNYFRKASLAHVQTSLGLGNYVLKSGDTMTGLLNVQVIQNGANGNANSSTYGMVVGGANNTTGTGAGNYIFGGRYNSTSTALYSTVIGGQYNSVTAQYAIAVGGQYNTAGHILSLVHGDGSTTKNGNSKVHGYSPTTVGGGQYEEVPMKITSSSATATPLACYSSLNYIPLAAGETICCHAIIAAAQGTTNSAGYNIEFTAINNAGTITITGTTVVRAQESNTAWNMTVTVLAGNGIQINAIGVAATTIYWAGMVKVARIKGA